MKRKFTWIFILLLLIIFTSCNEKNPDNNVNNQNNSFENGLDSPDNVDGITQGGKYGTNEPNATSFVFNASRLELPEEDYEYLNIGTYGTNNFFQMGGDIRIRKNDENTKVKGIELEKNTLGWIKFTVTVESRVSFNVASTSSENTSKIVLIEANSKIKQDLASDYTDINIKDNIASVKGTSFCKITSTVQPGTYILRSPVISDKDDIAYRKNIMLLNISIGDEVKANNTIFITADTLQIGTYNTNIKLFSGEWGSIKATANEKKKITIETSNKTYDEYTFGTRIKTGGKMEGTSSSSARAIILELTDKYEITLFAMSSNDETARTVNIFNEDQSRIVHTINDVLGSALYPYSFTLEAGTYYLTTTTGGLNIYGLTLCLA